MTVDRIRVLIITAGFNYVHGLGVLGLEEDSTETLNKLSEALGTEDGSGVFKS